MGRCAVALLLLTGCTAAVHASRVKNAVEGWAPDCDRVEIEGAPDNGWLWRANACGREYGCGYDDGGNMRCGLWPDRPVTNARLLKVADPGSACGRVVGHPEASGYADTSAWFVNVCGQLLYCRNASGYFECNRAP